MARITNMQVLWARINLGRGRGGSGATALDLYRVTAEDDEGCTGTGFTYSLGRGGEAVQALLEGLMRETVLGADPDVCTACGGRSAGTPTDWDEELSFLPCLPSTSPSGTCVLVRPACPCTATWAVTVTPWRSTESARSTSCDEHR